MRKVFCDLVRANAENLYFDLVRAKAANLLGILERNSRDLWLSHARKYR
jgi:hypothetical protein